MKSFAQRSGNFYASRALHVVPRPAQFRQHRGKSSSSHVAHTERLRAPCHFSIGCLRFVGEGAHLWRAPADGCWRLNLIVLRDSLQLRPMSEADRSEVAELIYCSINHWYEVHGRPPIFRGDPSVTEVFYDVYNELNPGCNVVAVSPQNGRLIGACFYHPREHHVGLGIMAVHPNYFCRGVGRGLLTHIIDYAEGHGYKSVRLTQSAMNVESFSLYNKAGFVPHGAYQDMIVQVPATGFALPEGTTGLRDARLEDVPAMGALEMEVSGISRVADYRYCIENRHGYWHVSVIEGSGGTIDGFLISCAHPAMTMVGPGITPRRSTRPH